AQTNALLEPSQANKITSESYLQSLQQLVGQTTLIKKYGSEIATLIFSAVCIFAIVAAVGTFGVNIGFAVAVTQLAQTIAIIGAVLSAVAAMAAYRYNNHSCKQQRVANLAVSFWQTANPAAQHDG